ncbi:Plastid-targeted protein 2 [Melia azedarach]|uniref:Plastid-targeted protein 2 n=1 Tax=Melia azedarach TaxID=155640 RepID=A0ACC1Y0V5_MELAZ|nr:Plastid-targeted protein 2 [Melia azedarach]
MYRRSGPWRFIELFYCYRSSSSDVNGGIWRSKPAPPPAPAPAPPRFSFAVWARWVLGSILSLSLPFWKLKREKLKKIEGEAEMVVEEAETVAEVVEKVATAAEKLSADVADILPDHSKLKEAALFVERVSKETAHDAHLTKNFIHKVDELEQDLSNMETVIEPLVEKIVPHKSKVTNKSDS